MNWYKYSRAGTYDKKIAGEITHKLFSLFKNYMIQQKGEDFSVRPVGKIERPFFYENDLILVTFEVKNIYESNLNYSIPIACNGRTKRLSFANNPSYRYAIDMNLFVPPVFSTLYLESIYEEIDESVRHEVEHIRQYYRDSIKRFHNENKGKGLVFKKEPENDYVKRLYQNYMGRVSYLSRQIEVEAFAIGFYNAAKFRKQDILDVIKQYAQEYSGYSFSQLNQIKKDLYDVFQSNIKKANLILRDISQKFKTLYNTFLNNMMDYLLDRFPIMKQKYENKWKENKPYYEKDKSLINHIVPKQTWYQQLLNGALPISKEVPVLEKK